MPEIILSSIDYKEAFESVKAIIEANAGIEINGKICTVSDGMIDDGKNTYVYRETDIHDRGDGAVFGMTEDGASWFANVRSGTEGDDSLSISSKWEGFLSNFSNAYHKKYFLTSYRRKTVEDADAYIQRYGTVACDLVRRMYPHLGSNLKPAAVSVADVGEEDIYILSLRLHLSTGMGQNLPVLGTLMLTRSSVREGFVASDLTPLGYANAENILSTLITVDDGRMDEPLFAKSATQIDIMIREIQNKLASIIAHNGEDSIVDYLVFDDANAKQIDQLLEKIARNDKKLTCSSVEILGISNVRWSISSFDIVDSATEQHLFRVSGSIDGNVSVRCLGCDKQSGIVSNNIIAITDEAGVFHSYSVRIDDYNFGLTEDDWSEICKAPSIRAHYRPIGAHCSVGRSGKECPKYLCEAHLVAVEKGSETIYLCRSCRYPEIMYVDQENNVKYLPAMVYASDLKKFINKTDSRRCSGVCGRYISSLDSNYCELCASVLRPRESDMAAAKRRYKSFASLLPLSVRSRNSGKRKLAFEDDEIIVFSFEDTKKQTRSNYLFHKLWIKDKGFLQMPIKTDKE